MVTDETLKHYQNKLTYAQNREDLLIEAFFFGRKEGFYVDVGGFDPDYDSVTRRFYEQGWSGINIEPQPAQYNKFVKRRPRDINVNAAVGNRVGTMKLRVYKSAGLATLSDEIKSGYEATNDDLTSNFKEIAVKVRKLRDIFKENKVKTIDFLKVDVEGFEEEVLLSNDWDLYRPEVLCVESGFSAKKTRSLLGSHNYRRVFNDGLNDYYVDALKNDTKELPYIDHMLIRRGGGVRYEDYANVKSLFRLNKKLNKEILNKESEIKKLRERIAYLDDLLANPRILLRKSVKLYAKRLTNGSETKKGDPRE